LAFFLLGYFLLSSWILLHSRVEAQDVRSDWEGVKVGVGRELIGGSVEDAGRGDVTAFGGESSEVGLTDAAEGEVFSTFGEDGIEALRRGGAGQGGEGAGGIAVLQEGVEVSEGGGVVAGSSQQHSGCSKKLALQHSRWGTCITVAL
jgi:hypothetical protein